MAGGGLSGAGVGRVLKELKELLKRPEEGIRVFLNEENIAEVEAEFDGPEGTPFAGGLFRMRLSLGADYPQTPPKGCFLTKIFHPNISAAGEVCVNVLKRDWQPDLGLRHVLLVVRCLLIEPFPESALNEEAGRMLLESWDAWARHAALMTSIHACRRQMPLSAEAGANAVNAQEPAEPAAADSGTGVRKPKGVEKAKAAAAKKRSLKRL